MPQYTAWFKLTTTTTSLNTSASFIGWGLAALLMGPAVEAVGRKGGVIMSVVLKLIGVLLMAAAQDVVMFVVGRIVLGWGTGTAAIGASTYASLFQYQINWDIS
jgi:fucose permease